MLGLALMRSFLDLLRAILVWWFPATLRGSVPSTEREMFSSEPVAVNVKHNAITKQQGQILVEKFESLENYSNKDGLKRYDFHFKDIDWTNDEEMKEIVLRMQELVGERYTLRQVANVNRSIQRARARRSLSINFFCKQNGAKRRRAELPHLSSIPR